ncbi:MAG: 30S ribosomal protein S9 [archaeon]|nr:30S ribosomal protein S9 [archaeon]
MIQPTIAAGKRKCAIAKARITAGKGKVTINKIPYENLNNFQKLLISEPIVLTKETLGNFDFDIEVTVSGGGTESRIEASRLAIAKAIVKLTKSAELKKVIIAYDRSMLVADTRRKEPYKPGDSKARSKRQKSYR